MARITTSARGEVVDFELLEIKQQLASSPKAVEVKRREDFVASRLRRRARTDDQKMAEIQARINAAAVDNSETATNVE